MPHTTHPSFEWLRSKTIDSLNITITEYQHRTTGAQHIHISADNSENIFLVALRTVPEDSTGVAHILEHTALCGSEKYPVRDPFFMMIRRSLNTFMNAMTSSDWTAYPFASQNKKDFDNLLSVYLDAVFFSRLDPLDFAQEGHRLEFSESGNSDSPLVYKGVVYNEMKGAMSSLTTQLWQTLNKHLFPTTTYHHNSGGEPRDIPKLSYEELKQFYQTHYHPSNAIFMTFGDISAAEHQEKFETQALHRFEKMNKTIEVLSEQRLSAPIQVTESYAYTPTEGDDPHKQSHIVMGWLLDKSINLKSNLEVHLLYRLLYDNSASPMQHLLETSSLGTSPSPLCGTDDSQHEMLFICGLEGCSADSANALEDSVMELLNGLIENGLPQEHIEASLHQLELQQREIGGDSYPYGLQLLMSALSPATHRGDIIGFMDLEMALQSMREEIQDRNYIPQLIKRLLVDNHHRVTLTLRPDTELQKQQRIAEEAELADKKSQMSDTDKQQIIALAEALDQRQQQEENIELLPKVGLSDIPPATPSPKGRKQSLADGEHHLHSYSAGTNGLCYQQVICPLPNLTEDELIALPYYTLCLTEMGLGDNSYLAVQQRQAEVVGNITAYYSLRNDVDNAEQYYAYVTLSAKALNKNQGAMSQLMCDTLLEINFSDENRIKELISQAKSGREQSITGSGHSYAMQAAAANLNPLAATVQKLMGLTSIKDLKACHNNVHNGDAKKLIQILQSIHQKLIATPKELLLITEEHMLEQQTPVVERAFDSLLNVSSHNDTVILPSGKPERIKQAWITHSQVHFCSKVYPTVTMNQPDAAPLAVLGGVLSNGYLHRTIRERGGAYGGGASQDSNSASFRFYSYRDPRMAATIEDFDGAIDWLLEKNITNLQIEESILSVIGSLDKPSSPAGEAKQAFHASLTGRTDEHRATFRERIIGVTAKDLYRVAETYLRQGQANIAVVTGAHGKEEAEELGLEIIHL